MYKKIMWFVDAQSPISASSYGKISTLASSLNASVTVMLDTRMRSLERWYWPKFDGFHKIKRDSEAIKTTLKNNISQELNSRNVEHDIVEIKADKFKSQIIHMVDNNASTLFVVDHHKQSSQHPIFQMFTHINTAILILTDKPWKKPLNVVAAVDPLHEHSRSGTLDNQIVSLTKDLGKFMKIQWTVAHACYVAPVLLEHKKRIIQTHADGLAEFAYDLNIPEKKTVLLKGMPEDVLPVWIEKNKIDLLLMGLVARNKLEDFWVGSTTSAFLHKPPCDMLLVK